MDALIIVVILGAVVTFVSAPLRRSGASREQPHERELAELEAAREAKYREIRDTDLDHRTGKLSDEDFVAIDTSLRSEAVEILHALDTIEQP